MILRPRAVSYLAEAYALAGAIDEGLRLSAEALTMIEATGEQWDKVELHRIQGELLRRRPGTDLGECEECFQGALALARRQGSRGFELRAASSLARLWRDQGKRIEARDLLAPIYGWFTEGFDTPDLKEAKALLDELA